MRGAVECVVTTVFGVAAGPCTAAWTTGATALIAAAGALAAAAFVTTLDATVWVAEAAGLVLEVVWTADEGECAVAAVFGAAALETVAVALDAAVWVAVAAGLEAVVAEEVWTALVGACAVAAGFVTVDGFFVASAPTCEFMEA